MLSNVFNKSKLLFIVTLVTSVLCACTPAEQQKSSAEKTEKIEKIEKIEKTNSQPATDNIDNIDHQQTKTFLQPQRPSIFGEKTYTINGEKFTSENNLVQKGSSLFNITMAQSGIVKGSFVVITKQGTALTTEITQAYSSARIAIDTFRLVPNKEQDLMPLYRQLQNIDYISRIELELDYSRLNKKPTY